MASTFSAVDLSQLPLPAAVELLDFETIVAAMLADLQARDPAYTALVESDPAYKVLEVAAYRETLMRQRVNDAIKAVMLAYAVKTDLDNIAARYNVQRLLVTPADDTTIPPTPAVYESDDSLRNRTQLSFEGFSTAGPVGAYISHALGADARVADVSVQSPTPGQVLVTVLSNVGNGAPTQDIIDAVKAALNDQDVRPLTDEVIVQGAAIVNYSVQAVLTLFNGPDASVVLSVALAALSAYQAANKKLGRSITLAGIYAALMQQGVENVALSSPLADLAINDSQAAYCTSVNVTVGGTYGG
jgi:phage-related baseplate assembly protein